MNVIESARKLGAAIQEDESYVKYAVAKQNNDDDKELQDLIGEFNLLRLDIGNEAGKPERNEERIEELNEKLRESYKKVMYNPGMQAYNEAKAELDAVVGKANAIIAMAVEGEDPATCEPPEDSGCGGGCSSCSGCK